MQRRTFLAGGTALVFAGGCWSKSDRRIARALPGMAAIEGAGVRLTRVIGQAALRNLDPFILLDRFHSANASDYVRGFPDHPHRGFETVTVMLSGRLRHRDSRGNTGVVTDGGIQWMTAGRGIVHSEMPDQNDGLLSGYQLWLNLPAREKMRVQEYQELGADRISRVALSAGGAANLISGRAFDTRGPVAERSTEPVLFTATLSDDQPIDVRIPRDHAAFVFVHGGSLLVGDADRADAGAIAVLSPGDRVRLRADRSETSFLFAAARPIGEPIVQRGPFVMNTEEEIAKAFEDYRSGKLVQ